MSQPRFQSTPRDPSSGGPAAAESWRASVHLVTFGCQMNKYDSLLVEGRFVEHGWSVAGTMEEADVVLFNTCSVRDHAEERVYSWLGELKRRKERDPGLVIGVMGCMAQRAGEEIFARAGHVDLVCGTRQLQNLPELVERVRAGRSDARGSRGEASGARRLLAVDMDAEVAVDRSDERPPGGLAGYLAVMRGCDLNCTFCIVPTVRGRVQSRPLEALVEEARWMVDGGTRAITLLGQTVNSYGEDLPAPPDGAPRGLGRRGRPGLADVIRALQELEGLERIRLVTLHPAYLTRELAQAMRDCDKLDRFLPLPVQSGSDAVLRRMKRGYTVDLYRRRLELLRDEVPDVELGSDWIVGFPGETDEDFEASLALLAEVGFAQSYVFQYDPRPGTAAAAFPDDVPRAVKKERNRRLLAAVEQVGLGRMRRQVGCEVQAFVEEPAARRPGSLKGRTFHQLPVSFPGDVELVGRTVTVRVGEASPFGLGGVVVG